MPFIPEPENSPEMDLIIQRTQRDIADIFADLAARQEPLGAEFEAAWSENVEELYKS